MKNILYYRFEQHTAKKCSTAEEAEEEEERKRKRRDVEKCD